MLSAPAAPNLTLTLQAPAGLPEACSCFRQQTQVVSTEAGLLLQARQADPRSTGSPLALYLTLKRLSIRLTSTNAALLPQSRGADPAVSDDPRSPGHPLAPYLAAGSAMLVKTATSAHALPTKRELAARQAAKAEAAQRQAERKGKLPAQVLFAGCRSSSLQ